VIKAKRIEFTSMDGCPPCEIALQQLRPIADSFDVPIRIIKNGPVGEVIPMTCVIKDGENGREVRRCIMGWNEGYVKDLLDYLRS
jgi:hypothetical protein